METNTVTLYSKCNSCDTSGELTVKAHDYNAYQSGVMVQTAFPYLTPEQREFYFISRMCGECWDHLFSAWDEEV